MKRRFRMNLRKRLGIFLLVSLMVLGLAPTTVVSAATDPSVDHVIINQVYGGSYDGSASHSFIELYNPTENTVKLTGWSIQYRSSADGSDSDAWKLLELSGSIATNDYYLIRCGATTGKSYTVPEGNQERRISQPIQGAGILQTAPIRPAGQQ